MLVSLCHLQCEWDKRKSAKNLKDRGFGFELGEALVAGRGTQWIMQFAPKHGEERYILTTLTPDDRLLVMVATWRSGKLRIISLRKGNSREKAKHQAAVGRLQQTKGK